MSISHEYRFGGKSYFQDEKKQDEGEKVGLFQEFWALTK